MPVAPAAAASGGFGAVAASDVGMMEDATPALAAATAFLAGPPQLFAARPVNAAATLGAGPTPSIFARRAPPAALPPTAVAGALFGPVASGDTAAVVVGAKALPSIGGDAGSALAQLALGRALLAKKDFAGAIRAFLTIKVFYPSPALLQPAALLGAVKAYEGLKDDKRAARTLTEIVENYPASPQASEAKKMIEALPKP